MNEKVIIDELNKLTDKAIRKNEVPVACIIVKDDKIIAKAYNRTVKTNSILFMHNEKLGIRSG